MDTDKDTLSDTFEKLLLTDQTKSNTTARGGSDGEKASRFLQSSDLSYDPISPYTDVWRGSMYTWFGSKVDIFPALYVLYTTHVMMGEPSSVPDAFGKTAYTISLNRPISRAELLKMALTMNCVSCQSFPETDTSDPLKSKSYLRKLYFQGLLDGTLFPFNDVDLFQSSATTLTLRNNTELLKRLVDDPLNAAKMIRDTYSRLNLTENWPFYCIAYGRLAGSNETGDTTYKGYVTGYLKSAELLNTITGGMIKRGDFAPNNTISRAEGLAILFRVAGMMISREERFPKPLDIRADNQGVYPWYSRVIDLALEKGLIPDVRDAGGNVQAVHPDSSMLRGEFAYTGFRFIRSGSSACFQSLDTDHDGTPDTHDICPYNTARKDVARVSDQLCTEPPEHGDSIGGAIKEQYIHEQELKKILTSTNVLEECTTHPFTTSLDPTKKIFNYQQLLCRDQDKDGVSDQLDTDYVKKDANANGIVDELEKIAQTNAGVTGGASSQGTPEVVLQDLDSDGDGIRDTYDNCRFVANNAQEHTTISCPSAPYLADPQCGDACLPDTDHDNLVNALDTCWGTAGEADSYEFNKTLCPSPPYYADPACGKSCSGGVPNTGTSQNANANINGGIIPVSSNQNGAFQIESNTSLPGAPGIPLPSLFRRDTDGDGVYDDADLCPSISMKVGDIQSSNGCPVFSYDDAQDKEPLHMILPECSLCPCPLLTTNKLEKGDAVFAYIVGDGEGGYCSRTENYLLQ